VIEHGFDSERGRAAIRRINRAHARWPISDDDYQYVLARLLVVPMRWLERYGWRPVTATERRAAYLYFRELGRRMGIKEWPPDYDTVAAFLDAYEAERFARTPGGVRTAVATRELFVSWFPKPLAPLWGPASTPCSTRRSSRPSASPQRPAGWSLPPTVPFGCGPEWCGPCRRGGG
jgi:hypothetical protein